MTNVSDPPQFSATDIDQAFDKIIVDNKAKPSSPEIYAQAQGIDVKIPRSHGKPIQGKLVEWLNPNEYRVVWFDGNSFLSKVLPADELKKLNPFLEGSIALNASRGKMTSLLEDAARGPITDREINNGGQFETLEQAIRPFRLPGGIEGVAATSKAGYLYETEKDEKGIEKPKDRNEDVWLVNPQTGFVAVIDGLGGGTKGTLAAEIVATSIAENENDIAKGAKAAQVRLQANPEIKGKDGACFLSAHIEIGNPIKISQCGDVEIHHFDSRGEPKYSPANYLETGQPPQSLLEQFEKINETDLPKDIKPQDAIRIFAKQAKKEMNDQEEVGLARIIERYDTGQKPLVESSNPLYTLLRSKVMMGINQNESKIAEFQSPGTVETGDWIILMSDGVADNFPAGDFERYIQMAINRKWSPEALTKKLSQVLDERIRLKAKGDPIAIRNHYKLDNATIIVMQVSGETSQKTTSKAA